MHIYHENPKSFWGPPNALICSLHSHGSTPLCQQHQANLSWAPLKQILDPLLTDIILFNLFKIYVDYEGENEAIVQESIQTVPDVVF